MPTLRADLVDAYVFHRLPAPELLQLRRAHDPLRATWQPVMGHVEPGESAVACLWRELHEETGLVPRDAVGAWALEQVHPFFVADLDAVVLSPRFAVEVAPAWAPSLNDEHDAFRWVGIADAETRFLWPGQHAAIRELISLLDRPERADALRLPGA